MCKWYRSWQSISLAMLSIFRGSSGFIRNIHITTRRISLEAPSLIENKPDKSVSRYMVLPGYLEFINGRDWKSVESYWESVVRNSINSSLPAYIQGNNQFFKYGITNLNEVRDVGAQGEFKSKDTLYLTKFTYGMRIGYIGSKYTGYQSQTKSNFHAVEDDIRAVLQRASYVAGRTDKGVSAISQIISFQSKKKNLEAELLQQFRESHACKSGNLVVYECVRVPRKLNPRACAVWRRYLYLLPLNSIDELDIEFMNSMLSAVNGKSLHYNSFCRGEDMRVGNGDLDLCTLLSSKCYLVDLDTHSLNVSADAKRLAICFDLVGNRFLKYMVRILVATVIRETLRPKHEQNVNFLIDTCKHGERYWTERPVPGEGLCLAGVGFDLLDLAIYKRIPLDKMQALYTANLKNKVDK